MGAGLPAGWEDRARFVYRDVLGQPEQAKPPNLSPSMKAQTSMTVGTIIGCRR